MRAILDDITICYKLVFMHTLSDFLEDTLVILIIVAFMYCINFIILDLFDHFGLFIDWAFL